MWYLRSFMWGAFALFTAGWNVAPAEERRVALVIGVATYRHAPQLANTQSDARAIAGALERLGFQVEVVLDPDRGAMEAAVRRWGQRAQGADASLFYYAGHALEVGGRNWLIPTSAELQTALDLRFEALDLDSVLEQVAGRSKVSLVFLDACRENPFRMKLATGTREVPTRGLGRVDAAAGTFVAFSTAPGTVAQDGAGPNSPFTAALLRHIETPGLEVRRILSEVRREVRDATQGKQLPWDSSALEGEFYFRAAAGTAAPAAPAGPTTAAADVEALFWDTVRNSRDPADLRAYLARFPKGVFAELARNRLNQVQTAAAAPGRPTPSTGPSTPSAAPDAPPAPPEPPPAGPGQTQRAAPAPSLSREARDALLARLAVLAPGMSAQRREEVAVRYEGFRAPHKAQAVSAQGPNAWRAGGESPGAAEQNALEACQVRYGHGCVLLAVDDKVQPAGGNPQGRDMPRVRYDGQFEPSRMPFVSANLRQRSDVAGYGTTAGPKAMAIHPWGRVFTSTGAADQRTAETRALAECNADPGRKGSDGPCLLYAVGNHVVLPQRLSEPRRPARTIAEAVSDVARTSVAEVYAKEAVQKALAIEIESGRTYRRVNLRSAALAEQLALEGCQLMYAQPCVLIASNGDLRAPDPHAAPKRDMPRLRYEGAYRVDMVPFQIDPDKNKVLVEYAKLPDPKAMAIAPSPVRIRVGTGSSVAEAEAKALAACNEDDPAYPCFIYAVNDRVVLPQRRTEASR
jgi:caspase domain-containing protein